MRLSEFITKEIELIATDFEEYVSTHLEGNSHLSKDELRNHIVGVLTYIAKDMGVEQSAIEQALKSKGGRVESSEDTAAQIHGEQRVQLGMIITDLAGEYRALRANILKHWTEQLDIPDEQDFYEMIRFNEAIDETLGESLRRFHSLVDEARNYFLSVLGHDLRSPLNAITGSVSLLMRSDNFNEAQYESLRQIQTSADTIAAISDNLLELARVKLGNGLSIHPTPSDLGDICNKICKEIRASFPGSNIILDLNGDLAGHWDEMRIGQVIANIARNAIEHGNPEGPITIKAKGIQEQAHLTIHNFGPVIPKSKIKEMFNQVKTGKDRGRNVGLGLYIAHEIVTSHGGTIEVKSSEEEGTIFSICLPKEESGLNCANQ